METRYGYMKMDTVVRSYLADLGYDTLHKYLPFLHYGLGELKEWRLNHSWDIKTIVKKADKINTVDFPEDFVQLTKLGIMIGDRVVTFTPDHSIATQQKTPGKPNKPYYDLIRDNYSQVYEYLNCRTPAGLTKIIGYGWGHNGVGYFTLDWSCKKIQFSSEINRSWPIVIEYITDGFSGTCETLVESYAEKVIKMGIELRETSRKFGKASREYSAVMDAYLLAKKETRKYASDLSYEALIELTTLNYGPSI